MTHIEQREVEDNAWSGDYSVNKRAFGATQVLTCSILSQTNKTVTNVSSDTDVIRYWMDHGTMTVVGRCTLKPRLL